MTDWSDDLVLRALQDLADPVGSLVRAFPGRLGLVEHPDWLDHWFVDLTRCFAAGEGPDPKKIVASAAEQGDLSLLGTTPVDASVRLISIRPHFFRGFRDVPEAIRFECDLVVIEGRNSSGKTSMSEAIEWVFTGQLSRRTSGEHGHPTELADCIANEFRPDGEKTSVELALTVDGETFVLRRVLTRDYSTIASDAPLSELMQNGDLLTEDEERDLRDRLLAGVHPILMQHNLRRFVHDDPNSRRQYFERLLQIDQFSTLIEKAVIGPKGLTHLPNPDGGTGLSALRALAAELHKNQESKVAELLPGLRKLERLSSNKVPDALSGLLVRAAHLAFPSELEGDAGLSQCREHLTEAQRAQREARLPLLSGLEDARGHPSPSLETAHEDFDSLMSAMGALATAQESAAAISDAQQEVARVAERLIAAGLIHPKEAGAQLCPICEDPSATLGPERVIQLTSWTPLAKVLDQAERDARDVRLRVEQPLDRLRTSAKAVVPPDLDPETTESQLSGASQRVAALTRTSLKSAAKVRAASEEVVSALDQVKDLINREDGTVEKLDQQLGVTQQAINDLTPVLAVHHEDVAHLEEAVGAASRDDAGYRLRERWLEVAGLMSGVAEDVAWEGAKALAKRSLDGLREGLIALRTEIIEDARRTFSDEMTAVWQLLRSDSGARFSRLGIRSVRGRGYKLEFELKAVISDGASEPEVDALRVFSESQVNVVGIAAYVTRARLLGHKLLIFDDPVQSMDEEHFRSFAVGLLPTLLDEGFQVVILTHSDTFARRLHDHHYRRESYATMESRASRRKGCYVQEGSRRVSGRLKNARRLAEDGDLQGAWRLVRLAIERLYTLTYARENDDFDPESWRNLTAEDMWNRGVEQIIGARATDSVKRLKEILVATAAGAHDKAATSETELVDATKDLATLLTPLRLGSG